MRINSQCTRVGNEIIACTLLPLLMIGIDQGYNYNYGHSGGE